MTTTYEQLPPSDLFTPFDRYLPEIITLTQSIVKEESRAVVIACEVFRLHEYREERKPFKSEKDRLMWLRRKGRHMAKTSVKQQHAKIMAEAIMDAIRNSK